MKIIALNGSPRGVKGMTWWTLEKFLKGAEEAGAEALAIHLAEKRIHHCTGELACWLKTPGRCIHRDDMEGILAEVAAADALVLATPVYVDGMTGLLKNCLDRMVPIADPHFEVRDGHLRHIPRGRAPNLVALVSVCGFSELDNFDPLLAHVKAVCRNMNAQFGGAVLRPAAPMIPFAPFLHPFKTHAVSKAVKRAGEEFARDGRISAEAQAEAGAEIVSRDSYLEHANKYFDKLLREAEKGSGAAAPPGTAVE
jgi:multimeric flavodoxin WrbA